MGRIYLNGNTYGGLNGPADGDRVTYSQILDEGTHIGDLIVNDTVTELYAPPAAVNDVLLKTNSSSAQSTLDEHGNAIIDLSNDFNTFRAKQDHLTAGQNIQITNNTISASTTEVSYRSDYDSGIEVGKLSINGVSNSIYVPRTVIDGVSDVLLNGESVVNPNSSEAEIVIEPNPQDTATDSLSKIKINDTVYDVETGEDKITDVTVDGTSVVTNNVAILSTMTGATSLADGAKGMVPTPQIADKDKFLRGDGTWAIGGGGSSVIPNPTTAATATLEKVQIDNTVYEIDNGSTIIPNPTGSATATLEKIQIENTIYEIDNGGGTSNVTYFFKNGNWLNTNILQFANSGGVIADGKLNLSGASCGVCVSNLGTIASIRPGAYIIGFKITDIGGTQITPQFGLCQPTDNEAAIIQTGANRISYKNTTYTAGVDYIVKITTSNNTQGVYFGAGYNTPSTQYAISEIWLEENINYDNYP